MARASDRSKRKPQAEKDAAEQDDLPLDPIEKARREQALVNAKWLAMADDDDEDGDLDEEKYDHMKCFVCHSTFERPVTGQCGHSYCLKCFKKWTNQGKKECPVCRAKFAKALIDNPRINTMLITQIRQALKPVEQRKSLATKGAIADEARPDEAFMTDNAKRKGLSNACSGRMRVTCHPHHFGPIGPEFDPERGQGILVGECWQSRLHCRQWGAHLPHVAGIAGQSDVGAQSVVLSGGYEDDRDEGEWFLYTGSGGRDLSGNKRTNKEQSSDQTFELYNKSLLKSCERGLPVRVIRSYKEKNSAYAPTEASAVRYDGIYRVVACWRTTGRQGKLMCRFLFRRCDNEPAPWSASEEGDAAWTHDLPGEASAELKSCKEKVVRPGGDPFWAYDPMTKRWGFTRPPPVGAALGNKASAGQTPLDRLLKDRAKAERELKKCHCPITKAVLVEPVVTPCGHVFSKAALLARFAEDASKSGGQDNGGRTFRVRKLPKPCPCCKANLADCLTSLQVNLSLASQMEVYRKQIVELDAAIVAERARALSDAPVYALLGDDEEPPTKEDALGWRVAVRGGAEDDALREGFVRTFNLADGKHMVEFDDGESQCYVLADERVLWYKAQAAAAAQSEGDENAGADGARPSASAQGGTPVKAAPGSSPPTPQPTPTPADAAEGAAQKAAAAQAQAAKDAAAKAEAAAAAATRRDALYTEFQSLFDRELIDGMLEDQGDDIDEVSAMLRRMRNQHARAGAQKPVKKGKGRKRKADAEEDLAAPDADEGEDSDPENRPDSSRANPDGPAKPAGRKATGAEAKKKTADPKPKAAKSTRRVGSSQSPAPKPRAKRAKV